MSDATNSPCGACPVVPGAAATHAVRGNRDGWTNPLNLAILHQAPPAGSPLGARFDYEAAFASLDLIEVKKELYAPMTDSQEW